MSDQTNLTRALAYLEKLPPAVSGSGGHSATFQAVLACKRFGLSEVEMWEAVSWFNDNRCDPPWNERELRHKLASADRITVQKPMAGRQANKVNWRRTVKPVGELVPIGPVGFARRAATDDRPIMHRSEAEEEAWWAKVFVERGIADPALVELAAIAKEQSA